MLVISLSFYIKLVFYSIYKFIYTSNNYNNNDFNIAGFINTAIAQTESNPDKALYKQEGSGHSKTTNINEQGETCVEEYDWERVVCPGDGSVACQPSTVISNRTLTCS